jgi:hypothetical protein
METNSPLIKNPVFPLLWIGISILLLVADYFSGPFIQFPVTYLIPVALASWYNGRWWGLAFAVLMPLIRFYFNIALWTIPWTIVDASLNVVIRIVVLSLFSLVIDRTANQTRRLSREVHLMEGLLPVCSFCKRIRDENNMWQPMEKYISSHSAAAFSHGLCPECLQEHYGDILKKKD